MPHIHEKIDYTVDALIVNEGRVLLRMHEKYHMWLAVGGHIELHEDPVEALFREVKEEVGLTVEIAVSPDTIPQDFYQNDTRYKCLTPPHFMNRHNISETHGHISMYYFATSQSSVIKPAAGEAVVECHWFSDTELDDPSYQIWPHIRFYAHRALIEVEESMRKGQ